MENQKSFAIEKKEIALLTQDFCEGRSSTQVFEALEIYPIKVFFCTNQWKSTEPFDSQLTSFFICSRIYFTITKKSLGGPDASIASPNL